MSLLHHQKRAQQAGLEERVLIMTDALNEAGDQIEDLFLLFQMPPT